MEYEQNKDTESRISELESSISAFGNDLNQVQKREDETKSRAEEATNEISKWKDEVKGIMTVTVVHCCWLRN